MNKLILAITIAAVVIGCVPKHDYVTVKDQLDSLSLKLSSAQNTIAAFEQVTAIIDSINVNQQNLQVDVEFGSTYQDYVSKIKGIQNQIQVANQKIKFLEKEAGTNSNLIFKLKKQLSEKSTEIALLKKEVDKVREDLFEYKEENALLISQVSTQETDINKKKEEIAVKKQELAILLSQVEEMSKKAVFNEAEALFKRAQALEIAAERTNFAPRKKRETYQEALSLYEKSFALGKAEAEGRIDFLKNKLS